MAKYLEYVISSLCPVCFACAWGIGVGLGRMRWGDCCGSAGSWRHEKGERLGLLTLGFDLDTTVVSLLSPAGHKLSSTDTIVAVFCCGGRRYDETAARHAQNHTLRRKCEAFSRSKWEAVAINCPLATPQREHGRSQLTEYLKVGQDLPPPCSSESKPQPSPTHSSATQQRFRVTTSKQCPLQQPQDSPRRPPTPPPRWQRQPCSRQERYREPTSPPQPR